MFVMFVWPSINTHKISFSAENLVKLKSKNRSWITEANNCKKATKNKSNFLDLFEWQIHYTKSDIHENKIGFLEKN